MSESMIANIRRQLEQEEEALRRLKEPAFGTARHDFINAKMQRLDQLREALIPLVGEQQATATVYEHYERAVNEIESPVKVKRK
jgi:hypothetical protein